MTTVNPRNLAQVLLAASLAAQPQAPWATTWDGGTSTWNDSSFWDTGIVPGLGDDVFIDGGKTGINSVVTVTAAATAQNININAGDTLNVDQTLSLFGSLANAGTFFVNNNGRAVFRNGGAVSGAGGIVLGPSGTNRVDIDGANTLTIDGASSITGHSGDIGGQVFVGGTASLINNGLIAANGPGGTITLLQTAVTNNGTLRATNGGTLSIRTAVSGGIIDADNGVVEHAGATIAGSTITSTNGGSIRATTSTSNFLDGVTLNADLDMTLANAHELVTAGGLVLNGVIDINNGANLIFNDTGGVSGSGSIVFGASGSANAINLDGNGTTTFGSGIVIRGQNGTIGQAQLLGGTQEIINNGSISADVAGGTITIRDSVVTNNGTLSASNGGTLILQSDVTGGPGSSINVGAGSEVLQNGVTLTGAINTTGDGIFRATASTANFLDGVTLTGDLDLTSSNAHQRVTAGGLVLNGNIDVDNGSNLIFIGDGGVSGSGSIVFGASGSGNAINLDGDGTTTIGSGIVVRGENGTIGQAQIVGGTQALVNDGTISADVNGGTITIRDSVVTNNGTLSALNGGTLILQSDVAGNAGSSIDVGAGSEVVQTGATLSGVINTTGDGTFRATASTSNFLDGVTLNGDLDLTSTNAHERVTAGGLVLNGTIDVDNGANLIFNGTGGVSGSGTIILGDTGSGNAINLDGDGATTIGSGIVVRGENGTIGEAAILGGTQTLINDGTISADVLDGTITIRDSSVTNNGTLSALNGGTLILQSDVAGNAGSSIDVGAGSEVVQTGVTLSGVINTTGDGTFRATTSTANTLDGVTFNGDLDLTAANAQENVTAGGLVLNGNININNGANLRFTDNGGVSGSGAIVLGDSGSANAINLEGNGVTTIGSGIIVRGENGTIGQAAIVGGTQVLQNDGIVSADVAGGTITIRDSAVSNDGLLSAANGGTLILMSDVTGNPGGSIDAEAGSTVVQSGVTLSGVINTIGDGSFVATTSTSNTLDGVTLNGDLDLTANNAQENVAAGGLVLNGSININNGANLRFTGTGGVSGNGSIVLGNSGSSNAINLEGNGTTTIGSGITVRGENGTIGQAIFSGGTQVLQNDGTINADVAGGTITIRDSAVINNGTLNVAAGATVDLLSAFTNAQGGLVSGEGVIDAPTSGLLNNGHIAPGASPGTLTILGDYTQSATGVFDVEVGTLTNSDLLVVSGAANLAGTLALHCFAECEFNVNDTLTILDAANGALSGTFEVALFGFATGQFDVIYDHVLGDVRLLVTEAVTAAPIPLPAAGWLLMGALVLLGRARRNA